MTILTDVLPYDITLSMLAYLFLSKVATLTQSNSLSAIFPYVHFCLTTGQKYWHSSIRWQQQYSLATAIFAGNNSIRWHSSIRSPSTFKHHYYTNPPFTLWLGS